MALLLLGAISPDDQGCAALASAAVPGVEIVSADITQGQCRVAGIARPRANAAIRFELWLPPPARWSGRYYQMGNGGFAGAIHAPTLAQAATRGDAAAATDTGHQGDGFDASWAAGRPDLVEDYGHRAIKVTSDAARALIAAYYGRPAQHRYYMGCSNGGRQALVAASRYPADWDGIIAGAPAARWTRQFEHFAAIQRALRMPGAGIALERLDLILAAARRTCADPDRPLACRFDPAGMGLNAAQMKALRTIEAAGYPLAAASADEWRQWILNPDSKQQSQTAFATGAFRFLLQNRPDWTVERHDPTRDAPASHLRATLDAANLTEFARRGGKIMSYFGWADAVLSPGEGVRWYRDQADRFGGEARLRSAYRLFMVPGMGHCQGGAAPHAFGQSLPAPALADDRHHDIRRAIEVWVEQGIAPEALIASDPASRATRILEPL